MTIRRLAVLLVAGASLAACSRTSPPGTGLPPPPTRAELWSAIPPLAERYRMEPAFIYALVIAESNGDPRARNGEARGLLQLKPSAWRAVSSIPYEPAVWNWRTNLEVGVDYLAFARSHLHQQATFSYPLLLATFHYGLDYVEELHFDVGRMAVPDHPIYRELWRGNLSPVPRP